MFVYTYIHICTETCVHTQTCIIPVDDYMDVGRIWKITPWVVNTGSLGRAGKMVHMVP